MSPGSYLILVKNKTDFESFFPSVNPVLGDLDFNLSNGGELIRLFDDGASLIDQVEYDDEDLWPVEPDGNGPTLELINPDSDNNIASSWRASSSGAEHGTPGSLNSTDTSVYEDNKLNDISINPNPIKNESVIKIAGNITISDGKLCIYNVLGKELRQEVIHTNEVVIRKGNLSTGIYICIFYNNNVYIGSQKFVVE